jgi:hypothetical protein
MDPRPRRRTSTIATVLVLACATLASAQSEAPDAVARRAAEATARADWKAFAELMHPAALADFRRMFREIVAIDGAAELRKSFFGIDTLAEYDALTDAGTFEALMKGLATNVPGMAEALGSLSMEVVGVLPEGEELAHVVYRTGASIENLTISKTAVMTLRRHDGQWRMLLNGAIEGLAERLAMVAGAG